MFVQFHSVDRAAEVPNPLIPETLEISSHKIPAKCMVVGASGAHEGSRNEHNHSSVPDWYHTTLVVDNGTCIIFLGIGCICTMASGPWLPT